MAGVEEKQGVELPVPSPDPQQDLSQGVSEGPSLQHSPTYQEDEEEEEEDDELKESQPTEVQLRVSPALWEGEHLEGVLDEDTVAEGLHELGRSAPGTEYVYLNLSLSGHELSDINILSGYVHLQKLELSYNKINDLSCVSHMPYLLELNASNNKLTTYFGFKPPKNLKVVDFSHNQIPKMQDLSAYRSLTKLLLDFNNIEEIRGLEKCRSLTHLSLSHNRLTAISGLENLPIRILNLEQTDYWLVVIFMLQQLTELDLKKISLEEKVGAVNQYDPPPEVVAAKDHMTQFMYSMLQPQRIFDSTLPSLDAPYPMLVLAGPLACGKRELSHRICRQFNNFFRYGPCHTTRAAYFGEENRLDYHFVSQEAFDKMLKTGKFIATFKYSGYYYGLGRDTVDSIAREGLATCVHLELEGVRSLKNTYFKPRYILVVPMNKVKYEGHLRRKGLFSRPEIEEAVSRVDMYIKISEDIPGYFDAVISADELDEAFAELSFLIKAYLGLEPPAASDSSQDMNSKAGTGSRIRFLQEQRLSPSRGVTGTTRSSTINEFLDSSAKNYPGDTLDKLTAQLSAVEEASLQRRHAAARQALSGKAPSAYVQLFQRGLEITPAPGSSQQQLLEPTTRPPLVSDGRSVTQDHSFPLINKESSCRGFGPASRLFPNSSGAPAAEGLPIRSPLPPAHLPEAARAQHQGPRGAEDGVNRLKETELHSDNLQRKYSKPKTTSSHVPQLTNSKPVLPPIPSRRKGTNP
ncbi:leucine-rich repeat and guanylate kinase domain-containing protein isoform X3 [Numida meleagris]|uniref:leucine-rich repeat and guanylate kinase domain-containing protein isoform X3 n=1 Tax=Numida meleagris TaxID=8996 RepID=UPI000B3DE3A7|nr:leucine-rich repeat and guanylate kinase domain-containing protein isoform X3 [Numida meleagris]